MTQTPPDWATAVPSTAGVHQPQTSNRPTRPFTPNQLMEFGAELIEQFLKRVLLAIVGVFVPGEPSFDQLQAWADNLAAEVAKIPIIGDIIEILTGVEDGDTGDLGSWVNNLTRNIRNALTNLIHPSRIPVIPVSHIGEAAQNLLTNPNFSDSESLSGLTDWAWDASEDHDGDGSGSAKALGHNVYLLSNAIDVTPGHKFSIGAWAKWSGVTATAAANAVRVSVVTYLNGVQVSTTMVAGVASPSGSADWTPLAGAFTVPSGVDSVRVQLGVTSAMTAGTVWFDSIDAHKTGNMPGNLVQGITGAATTIIQDVQATLNNIVAGFLGAADLLYDALTGDLNTVALNVNDTIASMQAAISTLQNSAANQANAGNSGFVSFATASDAASLGGDWSQTYSGSGTAVLGVTGGRAAWKTFSANSRTCIAVYTAKQTTTDYQKVGAAFASAPNDWFGTTPALNYILGRANSAGTTYVYVKMGPTSCELGCVVAGTTTVFDTVAGFSFKSGAAYWLECGTVGGVNIFKVWEGNRVIKTYTDAGGVSQYGASYRYTGMGGYSFGNALYHTTPATVAAFAFADNTPAPTLGSGFRRYRASASGVTQASGVNLLASNFFDTAERITADLTYASGTNNKLTVSVSGWYLINAKVQLSSYINSNDGIQMLLYVNGVSVQAGLLSIGVKSGFGGMGDVTGSYVAYLTAGDYIQLGFNATKSFTLIGGTSGNQSYFEAVFLNNTVPLAA